MKSSLTMVSKCLSAVVLWVGLSQIGVAADSSVSNRSERVRDGWRIGNAMGSSPGCLGAKRDYGHYRCGGVFEFTASPPPDRSVFIKASFQDLSRINTLSEDPITEQRTYGIENVNLSSLMVGKNWLYSFGYLGLGAGLFDGTIERRIEVEDQHFNMQGDLNSRYVGISGYAFTALMGRSLFSTPGGDLGVELIQTYFVTNTASNPRDERRVWATLPTLSFGWSYQFW